MFFPDRFPVPCTEPNDLTAIRGLLAGKYFNMLYMESFGVFGVKYFCKILLVQFSDFL